MGGGGGQPEELKEENQKNFDITPVRCVRLLLTMYSKQANIVEFIGTHLLPLAY